MNITFVSVKERTKEIGTRKALGARRRTILLQFLIEAVSICFVGGVVGLGVTYLLGVAVKAAMPALPARILVRPRLDLHLRVGRNRHRLRLRPGPGRLAPGSRGRPPL